MNELLLVAGIHLLAVMSPGPDFAMVLRNSLVYSRRTGILAAVGLGLGIMLHVTYSLLGIGLIISQSVLLFNTIKLIGASYLLYIGIKSLLSKRQPVNEGESGQKQTKDLTTFQAIKLGFFTNALNPKVTLFFLALFTQVIDPQTGGFIKILYGLEMSIATFLWFTVVAIVMTHKHINTAFSGIKHYIEKIFGVVLIAFGIKVALGAKQ